MRQIVYCFLALSTLITCKPATDKADIQESAKPEDNAVTEFKQYVEIFKPEGAKIISAEAEIKVLGEGFTWTEGPVYIADGDYLLFSNIPENKIHKWKEGEGVSLFLQPSGFTGLVERKGEPGSNGLLLNAKGQLVLCQHGDRRIATLDVPLDSPKSTFTTIVDKYDGKKLNSPNDAVFHSNGDLYFTDPPYGLELLIEDPSRELDFQGVYRFKPNGQMDLITKSLKYPNGITLSTDEKTLYVANSDPDNIVWMAFDLDDSGLPKDDGRVFYDASAYKEGHLERGLPDGLKTNKEGYLFATGPEGLWVFNPQGEVLAKVYIGKLTSNCALSADEKYIFLTTHDKVMRVELI